MNISEESGKPSASGGARREPKCAKCRNHGIDSRKKGHKGKCGFEMCQCPKCLIVDQKRNVMKLMIRNRRTLEKKDKEMASSQPLSSSSTQSLPPIHQTLRPSFFGEYLSYSDSIDQSLSSDILLLDPLNSGLNYLQFNQN